MALISTNYRALVMLSLILDILKESRKRHRYGYLLLVDTRRFKLLSIAREVGVTYSVK